VSKANLLSTSTINFLELIGSGKTYRVPPYRRDYSWSEEQWEDLWTDIEEMRRSDDRHYMGALVVEARSDRELMIIDGQQRMATLSILALAVIDKLERLAGEGVEPKIIESARTSFATVSSERGTPLRRSNRAGCA